MILLIMGCSEPEESGVWILSRSQSDDLTYRQIHFANTSSGWIVGDSGSVFKSDDGGNSWHFQPTGVSSKLWDIASVTGSRAWICGSNATLLRTMDGGNSWDVLMTGDSSDGIFVRIAFATENVGWLSNNDGSILKTTDAGDSWELSFKHPFAGSELFAFDESIQYHIRGKLFRTFDGGMTWDSLDIQVPTNFGIAGVSFPDENHGFISLINGTGGMMINNYPVLSTSNAGLSWTESSMLETEGFGLTSASFVDSKLGWVAGAHYVYKTSDGGHSFLSQDVPEQFYPANMMFLDENHGWAVSYQGEVYKYVSD
jgi:photosystem II stability/assembly factor-like uncharacterized protein